MRYAKKTALKLARRRKDYDEMKAKPRGDSKVISRIEGGGYHRPGSLR